MNVKIIVSISYHYSDVADVFFYLFKKNWPDCPFQLIILTDDDKNKFNEYDCYFNNIGDSLPVCYKKISEKYNADYYICLLGDALITDKVDTHKVKYMIEYINNHKYDYCNLLTYRYKNELLVKIRKNQAYGVGFISFIASHRFINTEFNQISDYDFEIKYLKNTYKYKKTNKYYDNMVENSNNLLNLVHGVCDGVWIRDAYHKIKQYPVVKSTNRKCMSRTQTLIYLIRLKSQLYLPVKIRYVIKKILKLFGFKFKTEL